MATGLAWIFYIMVLNIVLIQEQCMAQKTELIIMGI